MFLITTEEDTNVCSNQCQERGGEKTFVLVSAIRTGVAQRLQRNFTSRAVAISLRENPWCGANTWTSIAYADGKSSTTWKLRIGI